MNPPLLGGAFAISIVAGALTALFGVGGGFLITPMLNILLGLPMPIAVGTSAMNIIGTMTANVYWRRKSNLADVKLAVVLFGGNALGAYLGADILKALRERGDLTINGGQVAAADLYTLFVYAAMLGGIAAWVFLEARRKTGPVVRVGVFARVRIPPYAQFDTIEGPPLSIPLLAYMALFLGILTGLLGVGGGVILLPVLVYLVGMRTHAAVVTSSLIVLLTSIVAGISHAAAGNVDVPLLMVLLVGSTIGAQGGQVIFERLSGASLRRYFGWVVLGVAVTVVIRLLAIYI